MPQVTPRRVECSDVGVVSKGGFHRHSGIWSKAPRESTILRQEPRNKGKWFLRRPLVGWTDFVRETTSTLLRYVGNQAASQKSKLHTGFRCCHILLEDISPVTSTAWTRLGNVSAPFQASHLVSVEKTVKEERSLRTELQFHCVWAWCMKNVTKLPVTGKHNLKAWMNSHIFYRMGNWIQPQFRPSSSLPAGQCLSHPKKLQLTNVKMMFLPANTTSRVHPPISRNHSSNEAALHKENRAICPI